jgi:hypothetical protein
MPHLDASNSVSPGAKRARKVDSLALTHLNADHCIERSSFSEVDGEGIRPDRGFSGDNRLGKLKIFEEGEAEPGRDKVVGGGGEAEPEEEEVKLYCQWSPEPLC